MPPRAKKEEKPQKGGKVGGLGVNLKDLVPQDIKQLPREPRIGQKSIQQTESIEKEIEYKQCPEGEEWPGDDFASQQDLGLTSGIQFVDNVKLQLHKSFQQTESQLIFWRRPREYLYDEILEEQSKQHKSTQMTGIKKLQSIVRAQTKSLVGRKINNKRLTVQPYIQNTDNQPQDDSSPLLKKRSMLVQDGEAEEISKNIKANKENQRQEWARKTLTIFNVNERQETQEELESRKEKEQNLLQQQMQQQQLTGQKGKKDQKKEMEKVEEEEVKCIQEVVLSSMDLSGDPLPEFSQWTASIFQLIKDRKIVDSFTGEGLHRKIYPQNTQGNPVYNDGGCYWVKLHHMGRQVKVEVDDKVPCSVGSNVCLLPRSTNKNELWPMLFTKALIKLQQIYMADVYNFNKEVGQGWLLYALMGLVPQNIPIHSLTEHHWAFLQQKTRDREFNNRQTYITLYSTSNFKPYLEQNLIKKKQEPLFSSLQKNKDKLINKMQTMQHMPRGLSEDHSQKQGLEGSTEKKIQKSEQSSEHLDITTVEQQIDEHGQQKRYKPNYTLTNFSYSVTNSLFNETFNMVYTKERSEEEIKLRENYYNLAKVNLQRLSKEGKLEHRKQKKEMKEKIQMQEKERIELITGATIQYRMLKVNSRVCKVPLLNYLCPFSEKEIYVAKKCILNKLNMPPNYDLPDLKGDDVKSVVSQSMISQLTEGSYQVKPLDDFGNLSNLIEPVQRLQGGGWVMDQDLPNLFQHFMIYYDLNKLPHYQSINYSQDNQILLIQQTTKESEQQAMGTTQNTMNKKVIKSNCQLVVSFMARRAENKQLIPQPYFFLSKFDYQQFKQIKQFDTLNNGLIDSLYLQLENKNHVFKLNSFSPLDFNLQVSCDNAFKVMSESEYLVDYENYVQKVLTIEHQALNKNQYHLLSKHLLTVKHQEQLQVFVKLRQNKYSEQMRMKLIELQNQPTKDELQTNVNLQEIEGVERNMMETQLVNVQQLNRLLLDSHTHYLLVLEAQLDSPIIQEGSLELELLYQAEQQNLLVESIELNEVQEYSDIYTPNKYGQLFRERLFIQHEDNNTNTNDTGIQVTLQLGLKQRDQMQHQMESTQQKGKKVVEQEEIIEEKDLVEERSIYLQLLERQGSEENKDTWEVNLHSVFKVSGTNQVLMTNLQLFAQRHYYLLAGFDLQQEHQQSTLTHPDTQDIPNIYWNLQVFTAVDANVALVKDNSKETFENDIRKGWETSQPGRAERAARERKKYHLKKKLNNQEHLTEEEMAIVSEQKSLRTKQSEDQGDQNNNKKTNKKEQNTAKKDSKKEQQNKASTGQPAPEEKVEKVKRDIPKSQDHQMNEISSFLEKMEQQRVIQERPQHPGLISLRTEEQMAELKECVLLEQEHLHALTYALQIKRETPLTSTLQPQCQPVDYSYLDTLLHQRDSFRKDYVVRREQENRLLELCVQTNVNQLELEKALEQVLQLKHYDRQLVGLAQKQCINLKIMQTIEELNEAVNNYEVDKINTLLELIQQRAIQVEQPLIDRARDIQEEANDNPNFIAEKQAEAKKSGKKGKK